MRALVSILFSASLAGAAPVPKELKNSNQLEGTWEVVEFRMNGQETEVYKGARWKIGKESIDIEYPEAIRARYPSVSNKINGIDTSASPKCLDYTNYLGQDRKAIYDIVGDKMILSIPTETPDRPKVFQADETNLYYTFKRVKE